MFLIDTMVLSELRLRRRDPGVVAWISSQRPEDCFLSVVSIGEIERGIARKRTSDAGFAQQLAGWLDQLLRLYGDRLLPVDVGVARRWGQSHAKRKQKQGYGAIVAARRANPQDSQLIRRRPEPSGSGAVTGIGCDR